MQNHIVLFPPHSCLLPTFSPWEMPAHFFWSSCCLCHTVPFSFCSQVHLLPWLLMTASNFYAASSSFLLSAVSGTIFQWKKCLFETKWVKQTFLVSDTGEIVFHLPSRRNALPQGQNTITHRHSYQHGNCTAIYKSWLSLWTDCLYTAPGSIIHF